MYRFLPSATALLSCCLMLGACGQRGPLYLPHSAPAATQQQPADAQNPAKADPTKPSPTTPASAPSQP